MGEISVKTGNNARNGGKNSLNRLIRCVCGKKIGPDPRNFNQRVSLGRNDLLIRTFLSIQVDVSARGSRTLPFRINNCLIYLVLNSEQEFSVMVSAESFGELRLFRYPDGTLFNTFYRSSDNPLEGVMTTLWEMEMEITGPLVARFEHR
ncbi:hypothetical protein LNO12_25285 [Klebsiella pneumoniae subsp. pneumoniae]|uniref:hypothetical protein n=1 Tax=Klebsiella pneumoniae complex TaxID=3390273 RepID=UPI001D111C99|nr:MULTISPECIES: hypothetical protein [Klebsiella]MCS5752478.1 hypothetical protein [Klebsiella quasipneumoniae subsp. quasipneumoniae]MCS5989184.1 hypothetical protein [Klebsiella pneumoniae subsp. pneumoniae]UZH16430.1 hypothetical protein JMX37_09085 [Klebsiella pneumoniae]